MAYAVDGTDKTPSAPTKSRRRSRRRLNYFLRCMKETLEIKVSCWKTKNLQEQPRIIGCYYFYKIMSKRINDVHMDGRDAQLKTI
jgi:hypothetical protein